MTRAKAESHGNVAQYWDRMHNILNLLMIFLAAITTITTLLPITHYVPAAVGAITTILSAINGSLSPSSRRQAQMESSKGFRSLMLKMVRVETERNYEELWKEYNKELLGEPFLPKKYKVKAETVFSMTPEFQLIVNEKTKEVEEAIEDSGSDAGEDINKNVGEPATAYKSGHGSRAELSGSRSVLLEDNGINGNDIEMNLMS